MPDLIDEAARVNTAAWEHHARLRLADPPPEPVSSHGFGWTQYPGVGPGVELLGDLTGARVVELGCGAGDNLAHMAGEGVAEAIGVDLAAGQIARARVRWGHLPNTTLVVEDARTFLAGDRSNLDVCYSVFGALEFSPPRQVLPLIAARLRQSGRLLFSVRHITQPPVADLLLADGTRAPLVRFGHSVAEWTAMVAESGLTVTLAHEIRAPNGASPCCLIVAAQKH